jgi:hypothetical protein
MLVGLLVASQEARRPFDADAMSYAPVSKAVNNPRHESPGLIVSIELADKAKHHIGTV